MISDILLSLEAERDRIELAMAILRGETVTIDATMHDGPAAVAEAFIRANPTFARQKLDTGGDGTMKPSRRVTIKPDKRKEWTPARKQAHAIRMKKMWAKRRKASRRGEPAEG